MTITFTIPELDQNTIKIVLVLLSYVVGIFYTRAIAKWMKGDRPVSWLDFEPRLIITLYYLFSPVSVPATTILCILRYAVLCISGLFLGKD